MFKKIKGYFSQKKENREMLSKALLTLINDSSNFYRAQTQLLESTQDMNDAFQPQEMKAFMENMNAFVKDRTLNEDFYQQLLRHGREELAAHQLS